MWEPLPIQILNGNSLIWIYGQNCKIDKACKLEKIYLVCNKGKNSFGSEMRPIVRELSETLGSMILLQNCQEMVNK